MVRHNLPNCAARTHRTSAAQRAPIGGCAVDKPRLCMPRRTTTQTRHESMITPQHARARPWPRPPLMLRRWLAAARGGHRRDARSRAASPCRYRGRWLHGARCGAGRAAVTHARVGRGRGGGARRSTRRRATIWSVDKSIISARSGATISSRSRRKRMLLYPSKLIGQHVGKEVSSWRGYTG